jgi:hypothetical protein
MGYSGADFPGDHGRKRMRRALVVSAVCSLALACQAGAEEHERLEKCEPRVQLAERIMWHRQKMNDLEATWRIASIVRDQELSRIGQVLVYEAYRRPRHATEDAREQAIREFTEEVRRECLALTFDNAQPGLPR